jgi:collagenase-like PrtC family protease
MKGKRPYIKNNALCVYVRKRVCLHLSAHLKTFRWIGLVFMKIEMKQYTYIHYVSTVTQTYIQLLQTTYNTVLLTLRQCT